MKKLLACLLALCATIFVCSASAQIVKRVGQFAPDNDLWKEDSVEGAANITQTQFTAATTAVLNAYAGAATKNGAKLVMINDWADPTVNAYAEEEDGNYNVHMFGGLARRPEITPDGFSLVVCHELGHHLGGFPLYSTTDWAASEGQADYWGVKDCGKKLWEKSPATNKKAAQKIIADGHVPRAVDLCSKVYAKSGENNVNLCIRIASAGQSLADLLANLGGETAPEYSTPDRSRVTTTNVAHPAAQCRLDTYLSADLCPRRQPYGVITRTETTDRPYSCTQVDGYPAGIQARPRCWFKPKLTK